MLFFLIVLGILTFSYSYVGWRLIIPAGLCFPWNVLSWSLLLLFLMLPFLSIMLRIYGYQNYPIYVLTWVSYLSLGFITLVFLFLLARDICLIFITGITKAFNLVRFLYGQGTSSPDPSNPERHRFLVHSLNLGILGITGMLTGYGVYRALRGPRIVDVTIPVENLHGDLDGFRIVQITDIHAGSTIRRPYVEKVVGMTKRLGGDVIVFTGDIADGRASNLKHDVAPLAELNAPYGLFFTTGNHEYYSGVEQWTEEMRRLGFTVLINEHRIIRHGAGRILMAGVTDFNGGQFLKSHESSPESAISGAPQNDVKILLAHQPRSIFRAAAAGYDLMISGHTHGGQYFPWNFLVGLQQPYTAGLYLHGGTWIYVSRGTGYWGPPLRAGVPSEITVITLAKA